MLRIVPKPDHLKESLSIEPPRAPPIPAPKVGSPFFELALGIDPQTLTG